MFERKKLIYTIPFINFSTLFYGMLQSKSGQWATIFLSFSCGTVGLSVR